MKVQSFKPKEPRDQLSWLKMPLNWIVNTFKGKPARILFVAAGLLLVAAGIVWLSIYFEGDAAAHNAEELLEAYEAGIAPEQTQSETPVVADQAADERIAPTPTPAPTPIPTEYEGYQILGKLTIDTIDQELPIIAKMSRSSLKVSVCYYQGAMMGQDGNMVITGHNYASGAHFGNLDTVQTGDIVVLTAPDLTEYKYIVYDKDVVLPDNEEALDETSGDRELTLLTCASHGNRRLIVRCRPLSD